MLLKETLIRESIKQGILVKDESSKLFRIDRGVTDGIFDFLVEKQDIIGRDRWGFFSLNQKSKWCFDMFNWINFYWQMNIHVRKQMIKRTNIEVK